MKKIIFILLLLFTLTSCRSNDSSCEHKWNQTGSTDEYIIYTCEKCGEEKKDEVVLETGLTKDEWNQIAKSENFKNFTLEFVSEINMGGIEFQYYMYKFTDNLVYLTVKTDDEVMFVDQEFNEEESTDQRVLYTTLFTKYLEKYEDFVYDKEKDQYTNAKDVSVRATMPNQGVTADFIIKNSILKFNENNQIASVECTLVQITYIPGGDPVSIECYTVFTLSNFGTTVVNK